MPECHDRVAALQLTNPGANIMCPANLRDFRHRYELGLTYIAMDREKDAAAAFRGALKCPDGWKVDPIRREFMRDWLRDNG